MRLSEDAIFISDADSTVFYLDKDQSSTIENSTISVFQSVYSLIWGRISCGFIIFDKKDIETAVTTEPWVIDNVTSAFMMLINHGNDYAFGTTFAPMLRTAMYLKSILDCDAFLEYYFQRNIDILVSKLKKSQSVLTFVFNSNSKKTKNRIEDYSGCRRGFAVLVKSSATLILYNSFHGA